MAFELMPLPYSKSALEPHISSETIDYHYGKHHQSYVKKLNSLLEGKALADETLESIIQQSKGSLFNNAAQVWNHDFYWQCMSPNGGGTPKGELAEQLKKQFGSFDEFRDAFVESAKGNFGSGWTWLLKLPDGRLRVANTSDADTPIAHGDAIPLLTVDVWEHAYYIDYRNARPDYLQGFWELINWQFVAENFAETEKDRSTAVA